MPRASRYASASARAPTPKAMRNRSTSNASRSTANRSKGSGGRESLRTGAASPSSLSPRARAPPPLITGDQRKSLPRSCAVTATARSSPCTASEYARAMFRVRCTLSRSDHRATQSCTVGQSAGSRGRSQSETSSSASGSMMVASPAVLPGGACMTIHWLMAASRAAHASVSDMVATARCASMHGAVCSSAGVSVSIVLVGSGQTCVCTCKEQRARPESNTDTLLNDGQASERVAKRRCRAHRRR